FEGAGAISTWRIELPEVRQFDYRTITDVELELRYTALYDGVLRSAASDAVEAAVESVIAAGNEGGFYLLLSATKDFPTEWERLLRPAEGEEGGPLALPIVAERFPYVLRSRGIEVDEVRMVFVAGENAISLPEPVPLTIPVPDTEPGDVSFVAAPDLLEATVPPPIPPEPPEPPPPPFPVTFPVAMNNSTGPWSL